MTSISDNRIKTKEEIRAQLEIWFKYRDEIDYEFKVHTQFDGFNIESTRVTKFERMEE